MKYTKILVVLTAVLFIYACSGLKKSVKSSDAVDKENKADEISDEKKSEFEYLFIEALKQKTIGDMQRAVSLLSSCLEIDPSSSSAMYELANIHAANNDLTSASLLLEKAITINQENKWYRLSLATIYQRAKKYEEAAGIYRQMAEKDPDNLEYIYMNARLLEEAKKFDDAIKAYNQLESETGINEQISVAKQQIFVEQGKIKEAFAEIRKLIEYDRSESKYYGLLADLYLSQGDKENALANYNKILEMDPDNGYVHFSLSNYYLESGDSIRSFKETTLGFASDEVDLDTKLHLYFMLTEEDSESKITDEQRQELIGILKKSNPGEFLVFTLSAEYYLAKDKPAEARIELLNALEINQGDYVIWERVLYIDNELQDWKGLSDHSEKALELFPNQPQVYFLNAIACLQLEKFDETIKICDEGIEYVVDNYQLKGQLIMVKGEAFYKKNQKSEAFKLFDEAVKLDPENYIALNNYAYYLSLESQDLEKAERMSGKVIEKFPNNPTYLDTYAWVLFKRKNYSLAKFYMENALTNGGNTNPTLLEHMGDILFMMEKKSEASEYWQKARENGGESEVLDRKIRDQQYYEK